MMSTKILITSAAIVVVASTALLVPGIASGVSPVPGAPWVLVGSTGGGGHDVNGDGPGNNGRGHAYGHDKEDDGFPGNNAHGHANGDDKNSDGPGNNGRGHAYGHDKNSDDFPGNEHRDHKADDTDGSETD